MTKQTDYLVYRHGANAANQSMSNKRPIAIVTANNQSGACAKAAQHHTCYANQSFSAVPQSRASSRDWNEIVEASSYDPDAVID